MLLQRRNVLSLRAFLAFSNIELDLLAFLKGSVTFTNDIAEMHEYISFAFTRDETITFFVIEPLHGPDNFLRHFYSHLK